MNRLRLIHLYLGCVFAPLIIFFAMTGIAQTFHWHHFTERPGVLTYLWTLHTGRGLKSGETLSSPVMEWIIIAMALSLIVTTVIGIFMAVKFGHRRTAVLCLAAGLVIPVFVTALALFS